MSHLSGLGVHLRRLPFEALHPGVQGAAHAPAPSCSREGRLSSPVHDGHLARRVGSELGSAPAGVQVGFTGSAPSRCVASDLPRDLW